MRVKKICFEEKNPQITQVDSWIEVFKYIMKKSNLVIIYNFVVADGGIEKWYTRNKLELLAKIGSNSKYFVFDKLINKSYKMFCFKY